MPDTSPPAPRRATSAPCRRDGTTRVLDWRRSPRVGRPWGHPIARPPASRTRDERLVDRRCRVAGDRQAWRRARRGRSRQVPRHRHRGRGGGRDRGRRPRRRGGHASRCRWPTGARARWRCSAAPNRTTVVTGPLGDAVEAAVAAQPRDRRGRDGPGLGPRAGRRARGERSDRVPRPGAPASSSPRRSTLVPDGVIVGVGGSATTDGGLGALRALYPLQRLRGIELIVACDVDTRFVDAADVFGPQKGAIAGPGRAAAPPPGAAGPGVPGGPRRRRDRDPRLRRGRRSRRRAGRGRGATWCRGSSWWPTSSSSPSTWRAPTSSSPARGSSTSSPSTARWSAASSTSPPRSAFPCWWWRARCSTASAHRIDAVSLVDRYGRDRAMGDPLSCITEIVAERLADLSA